MKMPDMSKMGGAGGMPNFGGPGGGGPKGDL